MHKAVGMVCWLLATVTWLNLTACATMNVGSGAAANRFSPDTGSAGSPPFPSGDPAEPDFPPATDQRQIIESVAWDAQDSSVVVVIEHPDGLDVAVEIDGGLDAWGDRETNRAELPGGRGELRMYMSLPPVLAKGEAPSKSFHVSATDSEHYRDSEYLAVPQATLQYSVSFDDYYQTMHVRAWRSDNAGIAMYIASDYPELVFIDPGSGWGEYINFWQEEGVLEKDIQLRWGDWEDGNTPPYGIETGVTLRFNFGWAGEETRKLLLRDPLSAIIKSARYDPQHATVLVEVNPQYDDVVELQIAVGEGISVVGDAQATTTTAHTFQLTVPDGGEFYGSCELTAREGEYTETRGVGIWRLPAPLADDTLVAWPAARVVRTGEPVLINIATGTLPNAFRYMTGVRLVADERSGMTYVKKSFNVGAPGGEDSAMDGLWAGLDHSRDGKRGGMLMPPDSFIREFSTFSGQTAIDLNLTPLSVGTAQPSLTAAAGPLVNLEVSFANPGHWRIGFEEVNVVNRTYYQDSNQNPDYFWGNIGNDQPGFANSILVLQDNSGI